MLFEIAIDSFEKELEGDVKALSDSIVKELVELAPAEMRSLFSDSPPSSVGSPPANRTKTLSGSIKTLDDSSISMEGYAVYLDPVFEGLAKGAGWANRPFVDKGIDSALVKAAKQL